MGYVAYEIGYWRLDMEFLTWGVFLSAGLGALPWGVFYLVRWIVQGFKG
jgi:hypothetical protein